MKQWGRIQLLPNPLGIREMRDEKGAYIEYYQDRYYVVEVKREVNKLVLLLEGEGVAVLGKVPNKFTLTLPQKNLSLVFEDCTYIKAED
ncbi:hypothetical protein GCM10027422_07290 [Hymenobacter arcticus]